LAGGTICYDHFPINAWNRRDPGNPSIGLPDPEARVGRGKRGRYLLGYKAPNILNQQSFIPLISLYKIVWKRILKLTEYKNAETKSMFRIFNPLA